MFLLHHAPAHGPKLGTVFQEARPCLLRADAAGALVPAQITASAGLPKLFSFPCFFTIDPTVIATSRAVGYLLQTETRWLQAFSEQNKTGNLNQLLCWIQMEDVFGATARLTMY